MEAFELLFKKICLPDFVKEGDGANDNTATYGWDNGCNWQDSTRWDNNWDNCNQWQNWDNCNQCWDNWDNCNQCWDNWDNCNW